MFSRSVAVREFMHAPWQHNYSLPPSFFGDLLAADLAK